MPFYRVSSGLSGAGRSESEKSPSVHGPYVVVKVKKRFPGRGITASNSAPPHTSCVVEEKGQSVGRGLHEGPHPTQAWRTIEALPTCIAVYVDTTHQA